MKVDRYRNHDIELVIDRLKVSPKDMTRLEATVADALQHGDKQVMVYDVDSDKASYFSQTLMDPEGGLSYREPAPHNFSFNSPLEPARAAKDSDMSTSSTATRLYPTRRFLSTTEPLSR